MANRKTRTSPRKAGNINANSALIVHANTTSAAGNSVAPEPSRPAEYDSACNNPENGSQSNPQLGIDRRQTTIPLLEGNIDIHANSNSANSQLVSGPFGRTMYSHPQLQQTAPGLAAASARLQLEGLTPSSEVAVWDQQYTPAVRPSSIELVNTPSATRPQQLALEGPQAMDTQSDSDADLEHYLDSPSSQDSPSSALADILRGVKLNTPPRDERRAAPEQSALAASSSRRGPVTVPKMTDDPVLQAIVKQWSGTCNVSEWLRELVRRDVVSKCIEPDCSQLAHIENLCRAHYNQARRLAGEKLSLSEQQRINEREAKKHRLRKIGHSLKHTVMVGQRYRSEGRVFIVVEVFGGTATLEDMETFEATNVPTSSLNASLLVTSDD